MYQINQKVLTPVGKGIVREKKILPIDGQCYLIELENGSKVWRKESVISLPKADLTEILAKTLSIRFNLDQKEVESIIQEIL